MRKIAVKIWQILPLFALLSPVACQTKTIITTEPSGADIIVGDTKVGRTPIGLDQSVLDRSSAAGGHLIKIRKDGYNDVLVLIPDGHRDFKLELNLRQFVAAPVPSALTKTEVTVLSGAKKAAILAKLDRDGSDILEQQVKVLSGQAGDEAVLTRIGKDYPDCGAVLMLQGLALYAKGDVPGAEKALKAAVERDPQDAELRAILAEIRRAKGQGAGKG